MVSGLKVNFHKSGMVGCGVDHETFEQWADVISCNVLNLPLKYLGFPLGANPNRVATWGTTIHKFKSKLALWKNNLLP